MKMQFSLCRPLVSLPQQQKAPEKFVVDADAVVLLPVVYEVLIQFSNEIFNVKVFHFLVFPGRERALNMPKVTFDKSNFSLPVSLFFSEEKHINSRQCHVKSFFFIPGPENNFPNK